MVLIDTGLHPDAGRELRSDFGTAMGLLFRGLRPAGEPYHEQLRRLDIHPADVHRVLMTHLHVDHTSGMGLLPAARFTVTTREWEAAHARFASARGYVGRHLPDVDRVDLIDIEADGLAYESFGATMDLFGDGSIRLISTPGHTAGHLSILLRLEGDRRALIAGDAAYTLRSIDELILPMLTDDDESSRRSLEQIREFGRRHPAAVIVPTHDPSAWRALARAG